MRGYPLHRVLVGRAAFVGEGRVRGMLLDLGGYPGLVDGVPDATGPPRAGRSRTRPTVKGELYRLDDAELLATLDREEGYNFERLRADVTLADGRRSRAWVYRYRGSRARGTPIPHGDYRRARPRPAR
jgi:gamma-glutamylcyclotransferase (GGCT)/AIG2-like uncharacterized protein YtfP